MDVGLTDDQQLFRDTTRRFLEAQCPIPTLRQWESEPLGHTEAYWRQGNELGWTSLLVAERDGGGGISDNPLADLAIVVEEMGRLASPGPVIGTALVAALVSKHGSDPARARWMDGLMSGETVGGWAFNERGARWSQSAIRCTATPDGDGWRLTGVKTSIESAMSAGVFVVTAMLDGSPAQFVVPADAAGVSVTAVDSIDLVKRFGEVTLDAVRVEGDARLELGPDPVEELEHQLRQAAVLSCAETCGVIGRVFEFTLEYLSDRYSFGRPLASYQALKHRMADWKMRLEACHGITTAAIAAVGRHEDDSAELASAAKSYVGGVAVELIQDGVQLHGGIGVTWEHDIHIYLRRAMVNRGLYGSPTEHRERIATGLGLATAGR
jgi:alkylation response protein AidB-like acyl-CoA dehydrogenase